MKQNKITLQLRNRYCIYEIGIEIMGEITYNVKHWLGELLFLLLLKIVFKIAVFKIAAFKIAV